MKDKKIKYILAVLLSSTIIGLCSWYLFKSFRWHMALREQKEHAYTIDREIVSMQALGFAPESELVSLLAKQRDILFSHNQLPDPVQLESLLSLNRKMLMSYVNEIKILRKQGVDAGSNLMKFAYDKVIRLTISVAELERQLKAELRDYTEFQKRVDRMKEITRQSVSHYKKQLRQYLTQGISEEDERMQYVRRILTIRVKHLCMM